MDGLNVPMIEDEQLPKFITQLCYRPNFSKRTIPGIIDDMQYDIDRMKDLIKNIPREQAGGRIRKNQLYTRIAGRQRMIDDIKTILNNENKKQDEPIN